MRIHRAQGPVRISHVARETGRIEVPSLAVAVSQPARAASVWTLRIECRLTDQAVTRVLGIVETVPPTVWEVPSKVAAIASCPGIVDWWVQVEYSHTTRAQDDRGDLDDYIEVDLTSSLDQALPGVTAVDGAARSLLGRYSYMAGVLAPGNTTITTPAGMLQTVSAWQVGTGMLVRIDALPDAPVPPNGSIQLGPQGSYYGPLDVTFTNVPAGGGGYLVEELV